MTHDIDALRVLLVRVEGATAPDRDIDEAIHFSLFPDDPWGRAIRRGRKLVAEGESGADVEIPGVTSRMTAWAWAKSARVSDVTASLDAAMSLVELTLPPIKAFASGSPPSSGWKINLYRGMTPTGEHYASWECCIRPHAGAEKWHNAPTAALAVLCALLSALIAQAEAPAAR